ncbi:FAD:protein FMN transferase [Shewanella salipaludis]|uniref:FAD:protein FMN transferase n=1 Tax=Shewanella salipaludis TaxID=2723052 RepID=A0A972JNV1_9GAMM|nr:FAD:protein FMN transferase [Shewanella salipaludis]NMH66531.1 FAD:protein FMN transferase [Shewanella salipaludis]
MIRRARPLLGTLVEIAALAKPSQDDAEVNLAMAAAFARIAAIGRSLSFHDGDSELSRLNANPGRWQPMSPDALRVLRLAKAMGKASDNRFNCTVGGELIHRRALPGHISHPVLPQGTWQDIALGHGSAKLLRPIAVTLDGIAKGYAVDVAVTELKKAGLAGGWVNAGGDLKVFGSASLAVQQRNAQGMSRALQINKMALASSRVSLTLDPDYPALLLPTGEAAMPAPAACPHSAEQAPERIVSVAARFAWRADALTKVASYLTDADCTGRIAALGGKILGFNQDERTIL